MIIRMAAGSLMKGDIITIPLSPMPTYWERLLARIGFHVPRKQPVVRQFIVTGHGVKNDQSLG